MPFGAPSAPPALGGADWRGLRWHGSRAGGGMGSHLRHEVLGHVVSIIGMVRGVVGRIERRDRDLGRQLRRAANSVGSNVVEGFGNRDGNARLRFSSARGSLYEVEGQLAMAVAWGYVSADEVEPIQESLGRLGGRIYGLERRR